MSGQLSFDDIEWRQAGEFTTLETRADAHDTVDKAKRYSQILECFAETPHLTAKQCAMILFKKGYVPTAERNVSAPRITELCQKGVLEPVGKKVCEYTGKKVAVYQIRKER